MIKIAYIVSTFKRSGPTNQLSYIIKYLDKSKYKPVVITLSPEPKESMKYKFDNLGVKTISLNLSRIEGIFKAKSKIIDILEKEHIEIVHTQGIRADILSAKHLKKYKRVSTLRNYPYDDYTMKFGKLKGILMAFNHIKATKKIKNSIACSKSISKIYKEKKNIDVKYIQNGVDREQYNLTNNKEKLREDLSIDKNKTVFISVGSLIPRKDPITIIKAFKNLNNDNFELIFLGEGFSKDECLNLISDTKNIKLLGNVNNVTEYLQASDYFISASLSEGLPNTVMEAMACGLPCILSDIHSHREILEIDNDSSFTFQVKNVEELKNKVLEIDDRDYGKMSNAAVKTIKERLNAKFMSNKYQELYYKLLGDN